MNEADYMSENTFHFEQPKAVAQLVHEATKSIIPIYKPLNWFQRRMIRLCFGFKYEKFNE